MATTTGAIELEGFKVEVLDSTSDYADVMETLFDFDRMRDWLAGGVHVQVDDQADAVGPGMRRERQSALPACLHDPHGVTDAAAERGVGLIEVE